MDNDEIILGIDLGTTNSEVSVIGDGVPYVIPVKGEKMLPSCVGLDDEGSIIVGRPARNQLIARPERTVKSIKRKMGQDVKVNLGSQAYSPQEISSFILRELKEAAETHLNQRVSKAVITVPAFFNDLQRTATLEAGRLAGLDVVRILNEPTSAALAYEADHAERLTLLVYDLGGGTFDVSLLHVENGVIEVRASHGDTSLGGDDFDQLLLKRLLEEFSSRQRVDVSSDVGVYRRLLLAAERAKIELSDQPFTQINEEYLWEDKHLTLEIARSEYEDMIAPLLDKTLECMDRALRDGSVPVGGVDRILLVGGASRTPLVSRLLEKAFGQVPFQGVDPDLVVSLGAAIQAGTISGKHARSILVDITSHSFGTKVLSVVDGEVTEDAYVPVIHRNTSLPVEKSEVFETFQDNQDAVEVNIAQGESAHYSENTHLGKFMISGLSRVPAGNHIILNLKLDLNGILSVTAQEKRTGLSKSVTIDSRREAARALASGLDESGSIDAQGVVAFSRERREAAPGETREGSNLVRRAAGLRTRADKLMGELDGPDAEEIRDLLGRSRHAIAEGDHEALATLNASLEDMLFYLQR
jgi:molecular chaperone DnaK